MYHIYQPFIYIYIYIYRVIEKQLSILKHFSSISLKNYKK